MNPSKNIPENYALAWAVDMKQDRRLNWLLQFAGTGWFFLSGWLLWLVVHFLRPEFVPTALFDKALPSLVVVLLAIVGIISLHEMVHGVFFWLFSGEKPVFGLGPGYAYAAAPDWYFPKGQYLVIGLAPLVVLTVIGLGLIVFIPLTWVGIVALALAFNMGGAIGDIYVCARIAREAAEVWVQDKGDGFAVYRRRAG
jgi:hypothetical protein